MKNTRMTSQRMKILDYLRSVKTHPNAEEVYRAVSKDLPAITLATVYRNLNLMAEQGIIMRFEVNKEYRYDGEPKCHIHCICNNCGKILDYMGKGIEKSMMKMIDDERFFPDSVNIMFRGVCSQCKK